MVGAYLVEQAQACIANAAAVAHRIGGTDGEHLLEVARHWFVNGASTGVLIASIAAGLGAMVAWGYLPPHARATPHAGVPAGRSPPSSWLPTAQAPPQAPYSISRAERS
jgi:hypothetical protein